MRLVVFAVALVGGARAMAALPEKESWAIGVVAAWKALSFTDGNGIKINSANAAKLKATLGAIVSYVEASRGEQDLVDAMLLEHGEARRLSDVIDSSIGIQESPVAEEESCAEDDDCTEAEEVCGKLTIPTGNFPRELSKCCTSYQPQWEFNDKSPAVYPDYLCTSLPVGSPCHYREQCVTESCGRSSGQDTWVCFKAIGYGPCTGNDDCYNGQCDDSGVCLGEQGDVCGDTKLPGCGRDLECKTEVLGGEMRCRRF
jgi:hypothetical protein